MDTRIYYNPRCSKCRQGLEIIKQQGIDPELVKYLDEPPKFEDLDALLNMLGIDPRDLMRKHEQPYKDNHLDDTSLSRDQLIQAMLDHPILIERPIVIKDGKAIIGRPPEKILEIL